jgi:hypothetical protein
LRDVPRMPECQAPRALTWGQAAEKKARPRGVYFSAGWHCYFLPLCIPAAARPSCSVPSPSLRRVMRGCIKQSSYSRLAIWRLGALVRAGKYLPSTILRTSWATGTLSEVGPSGDQAPKVRRLPHIRISRTLACWAQPAVGGSLPGDKLAVQ